MDDLAIIIEAINNVNNSLASEPTSLMDILAAVETEYTAIEDGNDSSG